MSLGNRTLGTEVLGWVHESSPPPEEGDVLVSGLCGIDSGVIASSGGGQSGLHSIETGFVS